MTTTPNALSSNGTTTLVADQHGRGVMLSIGQFERNSLEDVVDAVVDDDLSCADPLLLEAIENPSPALIHPDRCLPYQKIPPIQTVEEVGGLWTIYYEHYELTLSFAGTFGVADWTTYENTDAIP